MVRIENENDLVRKFFIGLLVQAVLFIGVGLVWYGKVNEQLARYEDLIAQNTAATHENRKLIYQRTEERFSRQDWLVEERKIDAKIERLTSDLSAKITGIDKKLDSIIARMLDNRG